MGKISKRVPVKLFIGFIFKKGSLLSQAVLSLEKKFGKIDFRSQILEFTHTDYYEKEFGPDLKKVFVSFDSLIQPQNLSKIKVITNKIEGKLTQDSLRLINIDPGYLDLGKVVVASTKDFTHRIYLGQGIYAEVALFFKDKSYQPWPWTYPDYKTKEYIDIFNNIREIYARAIKRQA